MSAQAIADTVLPRAKPFALHLPYANLLITFGLAVASLLAAGLLAGSSGYQVLIVAMGWPHIMLGFLFYFGRVLRGEQRARPVFVVLCAVTLALWMAHYAYIITGFIAIYFTYHVFRDEVFMYFQTRARHTLRSNVAVAGIIPFILLMFVITDPRPQHYRQDLRRVDLTGSSFAQNGWTLISFEPISYSQGKQFYFYLQTPNSQAASQFVTQASVKDSDNGEIRISDRPWPNAADLAFKPHYLGESSQQPAIEIGQNIAVALNGGHRVGQVFTSQSANLDGIWLPTSMIKSGADVPKYAFHLTPDTSVPWAALSPTIRAIRWLLIVAFLALVLWRALPHLPKYGAFWIYFVFLIAIFAALQKLIRFADANGFPAPLMFQLVVVFHYWSWYTFSIDKLRSAPSPLPAVAKAKRPQSVYDRFMSSFGSVRRFVGLVLVFNLISAAGTLWYAKLHGPAPLRFVFDYSYFLYFLVLHVTLSFAPRHKPKPLASPELRQPTAVTA